jgi:DNA-binding MarR family transcriptional regulator
MATGRPDSTPSASGRPGADRQRALEVLEGLRSYLVAESAMQRRSEKSMNLTVNDISALRYLLRARERGIAVGPKELGDYLGIQSSSITVLLDRLERAGHIRREPSPFDRRALITARSSATSGRSWSTWPRRWTTTSPAQSSGSSTGSVTRSTASTT